MAPSAPALLSTTSCWPIGCDTEFASTRVTMSVEEPAGNGTTTRTGLLGYCACAAKEIHRKAKPHRTCFMRSLVLVDAPDIKRGEEKLQPHQHHCGRSSDNDALSRACDYRLSHPRFIANTRPGPCAAANRRPAANVK